MVAPAKITEAQLKDWVAAGRVPQWLATSFGEQIERIARLKQQGREFTRRIERHNASDALAMQLLAVPGIGVLSASALSAELAAGAKSYANANGRQFAACKGIAPRLSGTGGKVRAGAISKRGDPMCARCSFTARAA